MNDNVKENVFKWIGTNSCFYNFKSTEPNGHRSENCVEFVPQWNGKWNDLNCNKKRAFICEKSPSTRNMRFFTRPLAWKAAENECKKLGRHLATVQSIQQNQGILNELKKRHIRSAWIGMNDNVKENVFKWIGTNSCFSNFKSTEPNGHRSENCVEIIPGWNGKWNDLSCNKKRPFVCE